MELFTNKIEKWDQMIELFESLGGVAENIYQKGTDTTRGIYSIDQNKKSKIFTPINLLIPINDIHLCNSNLYLKEESKYPKKVKNFFNLYQKNFSWGNGGNTFVEKFELGLKNFPSSVKDYLKMTGLIDIDKRHSGLSWELIVLKYFFYSRMVKYKGKNVIAPVWELVNHKVNSLPYRTLKSGLSTPEIKATSDEITHKYSPSSPIERLFSHGFACRETKVFSLPLNIKINKNTNLICKGKAIYNDDIKINNNIKKDLIIEGLPIADNNIKQLPEAYWNEVMKRCNINNIDHSCFEKIIESNKKTRQNIINKLENINNNFSADELKDVLIIEYKMLKDT